MAKTPTDSGSGSPRRRGPAPTRDTPDDGAAHVAPHSRTVVAKDASEHYESVLRVAEAHPDLPREAVFKEDLLRLGVHFTRAALRHSARFKPKAYFIFSFDMVPLDELGEDAAVHAPEEIALIGGALGFRRTIVSVRLNPASPYRVEAVDDRLQLFCGTHPVADVKLGPVPEAYRQPLPGGAVMREIAPTIEWGYLIYLTVFRLCQYFGADEECQFCDINENFRQQRRAGRPYNQVKELGDILAALEIIDATERQARGERLGESSATAPTAATTETDPTDGHAARDIHAARDTRAAREAAAALESGTMVPLQPTAAYTLTGGSITTQLQGMSEVEFYCRYAEAIESRFPRRWISKMVVQAHEPDDVRRFRDAGVQIYHPNYEVWDERLFGILCPGKQRVIGRDTWVRRILDAAAIMRPHNVIPNFVAGIEMARPHGFDSVESALRSTGEGLEFFMSNGVVPRFTTWCPEPLSVLGRTQGPAPLEYHVGLLRVWRDTHRRHALRVPPGYGAPGVGHAVFSVSAFMDVIDPDAPTDA